MFGYRVFRLSAGRWIVVEKDGRAMIRLMETSTQLEAEIAAIKLALNHLRFVFASVGRG